MKFIDEVDIELVNQDLNFHSQDNNLVVRGGCDLFTTKPIASDRKLFKTIDKHLNQILEDNQLSQSIGRERQNSVLGISTSPPSQPQQQPSPKDSPLQKPIGARRSSSNEQHRKNSMASSLNSNKSFIDTSFDNIDDSPFGPLNNISTKKTFSYLIAILNTTYPDHDFSNLQPTEENFHKVSSPEDFINKFNNIMVSLGKKQDLLNWIWDTINAYMDIIPKNNGPGSRHNSFSGASSSRNMSMSPNTDHGNNSEACQIFEFQPSDQSILEDLNYPYQTLWSYYWFIYNKKKKRVTFIYLKAINKLHYSMINGNRGSSFSGSRGAKANEEEDVEDDEVDIDQDDIYIDEYDEDVIIDDDEDDMERDVVGDIEI